MQIHIVQNGRHFTDGIFRLIFLYENHCILIQISMFTLSFIIILDNCLALNHRQDINLTNGGLLYLHEYGSLGLGELTVLLTGTL